jgi:hypothetical protein
VERGGAGELLGELDSAPQGAQLVRQVGVLADDGLQIGLLAPAELLGQLFQQGSQLLVSGRVAHV